MTRRRAPSRPLSLSVALGLSAAVAVGGAGIAAAANSPSATATALATAPAPAPGTAAGEPGCHLGNGVQHVVQILFDNVHFFRDNPNVPSDLEQMPHLLAFMKQNGVLLSNNHTPLISHTAANSLSQYTGLYGDRDGVGISNTFRSYNADGSSDPNTAFTYWTDPLDDTAKAPNAGADTNPNMVYSPTVPAAKTAPTTVAPAPWVPYTRAGCDVGDVSTANMVLENAGFDIPKVFGTSSPEAAQLAADGDSFKDNEVADYVGLAVHCAKGAALCANASGVKEGQGSPSPLATADALPDEPGGYTGYQALFGHRYIAPQIGAGTPNLVHNGADGRTYPVTDAAGNLVDENGTEIDGAFTNGRPGFPGFSPTAAQTLSYTADMQESGIPVTYSYISDVHEKKAGETGCSSPGNAIGPGDPCYLKNTASYDAAFATFFQRLADDGITPANTLFVFSADEGDHFAGANAHRTVTPNPATCDGVTTPCAYPTGSAGEIQTDLAGLLKAEKNNTTPLSYDSQGVVLYVNGKPAPTDPATRRLARDLGGLTANNPYSGNPTEKIANYLADPLQERLLHYVDADPARTPTLTMFPRPDYFFSTVKGCDGTNAAACQTINPAFAYDHGYYAPEIDTTWLGLAGPGVAHRGLDGAGPAEGPSSDGPDSGQGTIPAETNPGTWTDHTDIRPTVMHLVGLRDDYTEDGRVISEILDRPGRVLSNPALDDLARAYKQINSSVGEFGTDTLVATTRALESGTASDDASYQRLEKALTLLGDLRDRLATTVKNELHDAAVAGRVPPTALLRAQTTQAQGLIAAAHFLATRG